MVGKTKEVGVRLSVKDADIAKRALATFGAEGQQALKRIDMAAKPASVSLQALNAAVGSGRNLLGGFVTGALGSVAAAVSLTAAIHQTREALDLFGEIADQAFSAGVGTQFFQGLAHAAKLGGVEVAELSVSLDTFNKSAGLAAEGKGRMVTQLKALNPELLRNIQLATTQEERVRLAADAIAQAGSASEKAALSAALFGDAGVRLVNVFAGGAAGIDEMMRKAQQLGIIVDRETIMKAEELGDQLDIAASVVDIKLKRAFVNAAPALVWLVERAGDLARALQIVVDQFKDVEERSVLNPLMNQLAENHNRRIPLGGEIEALKADIDALGGPENILTIGLQYELGNKQAEFDRLLQEAMALQDRIATLQGMGSSDGTPPVPEVPDTPSLPVSDAAKAAIKEAEALIERLRTASEAYGATVADLRQKLEAGLISTDVFNRGQAEAALKFAAAAESSEDYAAALDALNQARERGALSEQRYSDAVEQMSQRRLVAQNDWLAGIELGLARISQGADEVTSEVGDAVVGWADALGEQIGSVVRSGKFEWRDLVTSMLADIARLTTQQAITRPLAGLLGSVVGGLFGGGGLGVGQGLTGAATYGFSGLGSYGIPGLATGGTVTSEGYTWVGERGKELLKLPRGAEVIPNHSLPKLGGGQMNITLAPTYHVDGSGLDEASLLAVLEQHDRLLLDKVSGRVQQDMAMGAWG